MTDADFENGTMYTSPTGLKSDLFIIACSAVVIAYFATSRFFYGHGLIADGEMIVIKVLTLVMALSIVLLGIVLIWQDNRGQGGGDNGE